MKVVQVVPTISNLSEGPAYSVPAMCEGLRLNGADVELYALGSDGGRKFNFPVRVFNRSGFPLRALGRSPNMFAALKDVCKAADIVHTNSIWMFPNVYPSWAARGTNCKVVISPRGTVSKWALQRSRWRKAVFGSLFQYPAMRRADMFVATCESEAEDIRRLRYRQPIAIIPNGVDIPNISGLIQPVRRRLFFLSRIHPKKNIELLIRCWAKLEHQFPDWDLSIVGPNENNPYADQMKELAKHLCCRRLTFMGELSGDAKYRFMAESECEVLPTHSENFGMVVAEALACGTPVICSQGAPWEGLVVNRCGWWVPIREDALMSAMYQAMAMPREELTRMGECGREWMSRDFGWKEIGRKMLVAYEWLLGRNEKPEWIMTK